jgi:deoxycytidylate deaminase
MPKIQSIILDLIDLAKSSNITFQHSAAILSKGNKILSTGINSNRTYVNNKVCCSMHAEVAAINNCTRRKRKHSLILWD